MIKRFLVNGSEEKLSKSVLDDEISNGLLPEATSEDEGKVVSVDETGAYTLSTFESELPAATSEDEGKVPTVQADGSYQLGCGVFVVNVTENKHTATMDKTFFEIEKAAQNGIVYVKHRLDDTAVVVGIVTQIYRGNETEGIDYIVYTTDIYGAEQWSTPNINGYPTGTMG